MSKIAELEKLVKTFSDNFSYYKQPKNNYNEQTTRDDFITPFLCVLGWDVSNSQGLPPQYKEVIPEKYSTKKDRPDYSLTLKGVAKLFVEVKKPAIEIQLLKEPAFQARRYGWNADHKIVILTNFEFLLIYDATIIPSDTDNVNTALYKKYNFKEYVEKFDEIRNLISKETVYSGKFDEIFSDEVFSENRHTQKVDVHFLSQINNWRLKISNYLYPSLPNNNDEDFIAVLNDKVQSFINQIIFLRICEDRNLPLYHKLLETTHDKNALIKLLKESDKRYNSGLFEDCSIYYDLDENLINEIIEELYYPKTPYLFNIIEPNLLGKIYEQFLTKKLVVESGKIILTTKKDYADRSIVSTPIEIVKYIVERTLKPLCENKKPDEILKLKIADIACGSGIFLEEAFDYLVKYCESWYEKNDTSYLLELSSDYRQLPLQDKKNILLSCLYGIDLDVHAVEVTKFSLLIKLIENETEPSVFNISPILPNLDKNIKFGNSLVEPEKLDKNRLSDFEYLLISPFSWEKINNGNKFSAIIGNPPYVKTEDMHKLLSPKEFKYYLKNYSLPNKQFDKYFIFIEQAINKTDKNGRIGMIVPNKFLKVKSGRKLQEVLAKHKYVELIDDFGASQLFQQQSIYSCIICLNKQANESFIYSSRTSFSNLWGGKYNKCIKFSESHLNKIPWRLSPDIDFINYLSKFEKLSKPLSDYAKIFNGIQTSAESPVPVYWFSKDEIQSEDSQFYTVKKENHIYKIEKDITLPFFKPTENDEKGLNSYSVLTTDKKIIFPYDKNGKLYSLDILRNRFPNTLNYLQAYYARLEPKQVTPDAKRDVPDSTKDTWYQYGRNQGLTSFIDTPKLIVGVLRKLNQAMYAYDNNNMLIASGGTAGYCAIAEKEGAPYKLSYIQAWLANPHTEKYVRLVGSIFEGDYYARGTALLKTIPFIPLDLNNKDQKKIYNSVIEKTKRIFEINNLLNSKKDKKSVELFTREKQDLIVDIQHETDKVWNLEFLCDRDNT